jgi:carboxypeptidase C (cathepsin A)
MPADLTAPALPHRTRRERTRGARGISARSPRARTVTGGRTMSKWLTLTLALAGLNSAAYAAEAPAAGEHAAAAAHAPPSAAEVSQLCHIDMKGDRKDEYIALPRSDSSVTQHHITLGGKAVDYTATAGTITVRDDEDKPTASIGYVAYVRTGAAGRPITFAFNGGPGSSSLWLHMGVLGPRRVVVSDPDPTPPAPYRVVDNEYGLLDHSDLVMIDPVGTGISRAVCGHKDDEFWGVDPDIDSISRFIAQYLNDNNRWTSPKYLLGESYGTTRAAGIVNYLRTHRSLAFNGLVLVSVATDIEAIFAELPGNDRPYSVYLPAYAAVAWYHHALPSQPAKLEPFLAEVREYAMGPYAQALSKGNTLPDAERDAVAEKMHEYIGLPVDYLKNSNLRIVQSAFTHELLKAQHKTVGRLDGRFLGATPDLNAKDSDYDPQSEAISAAYAATFLDYYHGDLKFGAGSTYRTTNFSIGNKWKFTHMTEQGEQPLVNTGVDLADALMKDANLKVLVLNGYYDLATPFSATEYMMSHLGVPAEIGARVQMKYFEAGHMMYVNPPSIAKMKKDLDSFIESTDRH